jgi:hypothetical protein
MNRENIQKVRDYLSNLPDGRFAIGTWFFVPGTGFSHTLHDRGFTNATALEGSCGTVACIAGHTLACLEPDGTIPAMVSPKAAELLGLSTDEAFALFEGYDVANLDDPDEITTADAVRVLDHLLETGEVDWSIIDTPSSSRGE